MVPAKLQPALLGGVAIGVLSALPVVNIVNLCCCAWVVAGGALASHLMQQNHPAPINAGDGAIVGLLAGAIGALVGTVLSVPIAMMMGPFQLQMMERILQGTQDMPPEVRAIFEQMQGGMGGAAAMGIGFIFSLFFSLFFYAIFGLFGGLLGALIFRKDLPTPPPPAHGFQPPSFDPPPPPLPPAS
jgi:hypothetical protein